MAYPTQYAAWLVQHNVDYSPVEFRREGDGSILPIPETWPAGVAIPADGDLPSVEQADAILHPPPTFTPGERLYCQVCTLLQLSVPATEQEILAAIEALPAESRAGHLLTLATLSAMQDQMGYPLATTISAKLAAGATL